VNKPESWGDTQKLLAFILVVAFIIIVLIWMFHPPQGDAGSIAVLNTLVGTLGGFTAAVVTFYFGSSKGSKDKDDTISGIATHGTNGDSLPPGATKTTTTTAAPIVPDATTTTTTTAPPN
jgi:hypothetical protein